MLKNSSPEKMFKKTQDPDRYVIYPLILKNSSPDQKFVDPEHITRAGVQ
jgi:hypothetical protein